MNIKTTIKQLVVGIFALGAFAGAAQADATLIGLDHSFQLTGATNLTVNAGSTVLISLPNGDTVLVEKQSQVPTDLSGATIDVFSGCVSASGGNGVSVCVGDNQGKAVALNGPITMTTDVGRSITLNKGDEYYIAFAGEYAQEELAPPTAAFGDVEGDSTGGFNPFDGGNTNDLRDGPPSP